MRLTDLLKTKKGKQVATILGIGVIFLTGVHYFYTIKINRLKLKELELKNKKLEEN